MVIILIIVEMVEANELGTSQMMIDTTGGRN